MTQRKGDPKTYCNPLPIPEIPRGVDNETIFGGHPGLYDPVDPMKEPDPGSELWENEMRQIRDYRSISDPTVMYWDGKWYLYPSSGMCWVSEDFVAWKHVRTSPYCPKYSPHIVPWKGRFLLTAWNCPLYVTDDPCGPFHMLGDFIRQDGSAFKPIDPGLFIDDDGRLYLYEVTVVNLDKTPRGVVRIQGYELDKDDPRIVVDGPVLILEMNPEGNWFERFGSYHQNQHFGWVEGPHLVKHKGRYYLIYATPGTTHPTYANGVLISDESPLRGFRYQKKNPLTYRTDGIVSGPGHGCVEHGPDGTLWVFYTVIAPSAHEYERRIGMDRVEIDENGEMYCPNGVTNVPQYGPGEMKDPAETPGLSSLLGWNRPEEVSSEVYGREALYACDESILTWWEPAKDDPQPRITFALDPEGFMVSASRVFWKEIGLDYAKGVVPGPMRYLIEGRWRGEWFTLLDRRNSEEELNVDYRTFPPRVCDRIRITVTGWPEGMTPGIIDFTVFGK